MFLPISVVLIRVGVQNGTKMLMKVVIVEEYLLKQTPIHLVSLTFRLVRLSHWLGQHTGRVFPEPYDHRPFDGLVEQRPARAVAALTHAARRGDYPAEFWRSTLWEWPDGARHRLSWLFGARLARLPSETVVELRDDVFGWLLEAFAETGRAGSTSCPEHIRCTARKAIHR